MEGSSTEAGELGQLVRKKERGPVVAEREQISSQKPITPSAIRRTEQSELSQQQQNLQQIVPIIQAIKKQIIILIDWI